MNLREKLLSSNRRTKQFIAALTDFLSISFATGVAIFFTGQDINDFSAIEFIRLIWVPLFSIFVFYLFGIYKSVLRFIDLVFIYLLIKAIFIALSLNLVIRFSYFYVAGKFASESIINIFPLKEWLIGSLLSIVLLLFSRILANYFFSNKKHEKRVVIYGAGSAGIQLASALRVSKEMHPIAFVDSNTTLQNTFIGGIKVLHPKKLIRLASRGKVDEVLIAMPSASKLTLKNLLKEIEQLSVKVRILPGLADLAQGKVLVSELKEVDVSDILGRLEVEANQRLIDKDLQGKVVLITGAGGSIGSEIARQVASNKPRKLIILDSSEYALFNLKNEIEELNPKVNLYSILANVTNKNRILEIFKVFEVNTVYHAAAYKHVPLVEENPFEAISNNIYGTKVCAEAAIEANVETFVLISTDKAVRPTNIMGATKRFAELILQSLATNPITRMTMVRFGNVIGSSGSAIPLFQKQIKDGGPVTVTHPDVIRYFMTIPEAAELVIQAGAMGRGGDVFVLDMGEPVKIYELAKRLIKLSGMEVIDETHPEGDIEIRFTGLRPGEKLYEELLIGDNVSTTEHKRILKAQEEHLPYETLKSLMDQLEKAEGKGDVESLKNILKDAVNGFSPEKQIVDIVYLQKTLN
jgi:FlaA1/EpsC-like NDP-sugar epimerase